MENIGLHIAFQGPSLNMQTPMIFQLFPCPGALDSDSWYIMAITETLFCLTMSWKFKDSLSKLIFSMICLVHGLETFSVSNVAISEANAV